MSAINPFFHRGPIHDQRYFYGRDYETAQVLSLVAQRQSVSLVGQRHIGKTSLLNHISNPLVFAQHGLKRDQALFVYVDGSTLSGLDPPQVYRVLLEDIQFSLAHSTSTPDWFNREALINTPLPPYPNRSRALGPGPGHGGGPILLALSHGSAG